MPGKRCALDHLGGHFCSTALFTASKALRQDFERDRRRRSERRKLLHFVID